MNRASLAKRLAAVTIGGLAAAAGLAAMGQTPPAGRPVAQLPGYLDAGSIPDERTFLPPPPADGSAAGRADLAVFRSTRALAGSARWRLAAQDAAAAPESLLADFDCALGARLGTAETPVLARLSKKVMGDAFKIVGPAKDRYQRPRPFLRANGPICIATADLAGSGSYPSGHATVGWLQALILAELAPGRASQILARGRAYGESRAVCGVHFVSDLEGGRTAAAALFSTLHSSADFRADMDAARTEVSALLADGTARATATNCATEAAALSARPW